MSNSKSELSSLDSDIDDMNTVVKVYTTEEQKALRRLPGNDKRVFHHGKLVAEGEEDTLGRKYVAHGSSKSLIEKDAKGMWSSTMYFKGKQFATADDFFTTLKSTVATEKLEEISSEIMASIESQQGVQSLILSAIVRVVNPNNFELFDVDGIINTAELERVMENNGFLGRFANMLKSDASNRKNKLQAQRNLEAFTSVFTSNIARQWVSSSPTFFAHNLCILLKDIAATFDHAMPIDVTMRFGKFEVAWALFICAVNQEYVKALTSTKTRKVVPLAIRHLRSAFDLIRGQEVILEFPDFEDLRNLLLKANRFGILTPIEGTKRGKTAAFDDWEKSLKGNAQARHISAPESRHKFFFIEDKPSNEPAQQEDVDMVDAGPSQPEEVDAGPSQPEEVDAGPSQPEEVDAGPSQPEEVDAGPSQPEEIGLAAGAGSSPEEEPESADEEVERKLTKLGIVTPKKRSSRTLFGSNATTRDAPSLIILDEESEEEEKRKRLTTRVHWNQKRHNRRLAPLPVKACTVEKPCSGIPRSWLSAVERLDEAEAFGYLVDFYRHVESGGYTICIFHLSNLYARLHMKGMIHEPVREQVQDSLGEFAIALMSNEYKKWVYDNLDLFSSSLQVPNLDEKMLTLDLAQVNGIRGYMNFDQKYHDEDDFNWSSMTAYSLDWIMKDVEFREILEDELQLQRHYENGGTVYHSLLQQVLRFDPGLYLVNVGARWDGTFQMVHYVNGIDFETEGPYSEEDNGNLTREVYAPFWPVVVAHGHGADVKHMICSLNAELDLTTIKFNMKALLDSEDFAAHLNDQFYDTTGKHIEDENNAVRVYIMVNKYKAILFDEPTFFSVGRKARNKSINAPMQVFLEKWPVPVVHLAMLKVMGSSTEYLLGDSLRRITNSHRDQTAPHRLLNGKLVTEVVKSVFLSKISPPSMCAAAVIGQVDWEGPGIARELEMLFDPTTRDKGVKQIRQDIKQLVIKAYSNIKKKEYTANGGKGYFTGESWEVSTSKYRRDFLEAKQKELEAKQKDK